MSEKEEDLMNIYNKLLSFDQDITQLADICCTIASTFGPKTKYSLVGSLTEGAVLVRSLASNSWEIEADVMTENGSYDEETFSDITEAIPGNIGLYKLVIAEYDFRCSKEKSPFLSGMAFKECVSSYSNIAATKFGKTLSHILGLKTECTFKSKKEFHGPSVTWIEDISHNCQAIGSISVDHVSSIQFHFWPAEAAEWVTRKRHWPPPESNLICLAMEKGCQLVPKPWCSDRHKTCVDHEQWRLSFSKAEVFLAKHRTPNQKLVYLMAKAIFYSHLNVEVNGSKFSSYCLKTVMMKALEDVKPEMWAQEHIFSRVTDLIERLAQAVSKRHLPYTFISSINLLEEYSEEMLTAVELKLTDISSKGVVACIPSTTVVNALLVKFKIMRTNMDKCILTLLLHFTSKNDTQYEDYDLD